tara:strand:+ start:411 stop:1640 length:1230 start_codon:yes stop_codon:yes gene_type:complete
MTRRVVITGMGAVSPIGNNISTFNHSLQNGTNGISHITQFDTSEFDVNIAGEVKIEIENFIERKALNRQDRFSSLAIIACDEAIKASGIDDEKLNKERIGVIVGSGIGGISTFEAQYRNLMKKPKRVSPFFIPSMISDIASGHISIKYGFQGLNYSLVSACATASHAIGDAFRMISYNDADIIVTGGSDATITPMAIAGFSNMKALSKNNNPHNASRPFDANRDGFVMGEGSGIIILEELQHAKDRNANIIAEVCGYAATGDAYHITSPASDGSGATRAMQLALNNAKCNPDDINYLNAHGTSTPYNDKIETLAIKNVFYKSLNKLNISSTKSMTGHLLGAAGGIEAIASILSIVNNYIPPTINYETIDTECDLDYTPNNAKETIVDYAMSNAFGFGGHNAVLIFKSFS